MVDRTSTHKYRTRHATRLLASGSDFEGVASSLNPCATTQASYDQASINPQSTLATTGAGRATAPTLYSSQVSRPELTLLDPSKPPSSVAISAASEAEACEMIEKMVKFPESDQQEHWDLHHSILKRHLQRYEAAEEELINARNAPKSTRVRNDGVWCSDPSRETLELIFHAINAYTALVRGVLELQACGGRNGNKPPPQICLAINWGADQKIMADKAKLWTGFAALIRKERLLPEFARLGASGRVAAQPEHALGLRFVRMNPTNGRPEIFSTLSIEQGVRAPADANYEEQHNPTDH
jgi:hypothetical protein